MNEEPAYEDSAQRHLREICEMFVQAKAASLEACNHQHRYCLRQRRRAVWFLIPVALLYAALAWFNFRNWREELLWMRCLDCFVVGIMAAIFAHLVAHCVYVRRVMLARAQMWLHAREAIHDAPTPTPGDLL